MNKFNNIKYDFLENYKIENDLIEINTKTDLDDFNNRVFILKFKPTNPEVTLSFHSLSEIVLIEDAKRKHLIYYQKFVKNVPYTKENYLAGTIYEISNSEDFFQVINKEIEDLKIEVEYFNENNNIYSKNNVDSIFDLEF